MRLCCVLLSPTWGMHAYTADLANRMAAAGHEVSVVTTRPAPRECYAPSIRIDTPISTTNTGFSAEGVNPRAPAAVRHLQCATIDLRPDVVHLTGPHLWNPWLLRGLRRAGIPTVHTLHDVHPHAGAAYGRLLHVWNDWVCREAGHILVHGDCFRQELLREVQRGRRAPHRRPDAPMASAVERIACTPLTHLFMSYRREQALRDAEQQRPGVARYEPWALLMGRMEPYKGVDVLAEAVWQLGPAREPVAVAAGPGWNDRLVRGVLPPGLQVRPGLAGDEEAVDLFSRCGLVVLPYVEASQSALIAAAYFFRKPVLVTRAGALPEYVVEGETGWVIPPADAAALAAVLRAALSDPSRLRRMGDAGRAWYDRARAAETEALLAMYVRAAKR